MNINPSYNCEMTIDKNASAFIRQAIKNGGVVTVYANSNINELKNFYVPWDCDKVNDLAHDKRNSEHEWTTKSSKFEYFRDRYINNPHQDVTIFAERLVGGPILIIDGVHRAVGLQKALNLQKSIEQHINLIVVLFELQTPDNDYLKIISSPSYIS